MEKKTSPRLAKKIKTLVLLVVLVLVMGGAQPFLWRMVTTSSEKLQMERSKSKQIETVKALREEVREEYTGQQPFLDQLTVVVPMRRDVLQVIERLEELAQKEGVAVEVVSIKEGESLSKSDKKKSERTTGPSIYPLTLSVSAIGDSGQLLRYIESVENAREITSIQSFTMSSFFYQSSSGQPTGYAYKLDIDINFYLQDNGDG